jgi:hypothetical protein
VNGRDNGPVVGGDSPLVSKPVPPTCRRLDRLLRFLVKDNG